MIFRFFLLFCLTVVASVAFSQPVEMLLWPDGAPNDNGIRMPEQEAAAGRVSGVSQSSMYVYLPAGAATPTTAVVICPGGGYVRLAMVHEGHEFARWLNENGMAAIVLKYRMPNGHHEVPLSDAQQALRLVRRHSREWNIAPDRVGIAGFSAGGHLASTAATHFSDSLTRPDFAVLFYPVVSMGATAHAGSRLQLIGESPSPERQREYSNEWRVTAATPPTLLLLSDDDQTVDPLNSSAFYDALKQYRVPAAMYVFPTGGHGWGMRSDFVYHDVWKELVKRWLDELAVKN
ncbi:MAG: alpha/beta hydrolase [Prevotellaceae bacterium]|jgi:acetyl esterase/lipase|nr:alpha/beta hydrolase [Prevotellaceae bacterium]